MKAIHDWDPYVDSHKRLVYVLTTEEECRAFEADCENAVRLKWDEKYKANFFLSSAYREAIREQVPKFKEDDAPYPYADIYQAENGVVHPRLPIYYCWERSSKSVYYFTDIAES